MVDCETDNQMTYLNLSSLEVTESLLGLKKKEILRTIEKLKKLTISSTISSLLPCFKKTKNLMLRDGMKPPSDEVVDPSDLSLTNLDGERDGEVEVGVEWW